MRWYAELGKRGAYWIFYTLFQNDFTAWWAPPQLLTEGVRIYACIAVQIARDLQVA